MMAGNFIALLRVCTADRTVLAQGLRGSRDQIVFTSKQDRASDRR